MRKVRTQRGIKRRGGSGCAPGEQNGNAVEDGITAPASGAADEALIEREGLAADGAD